MEGPTATRRLSRLTLGQFLALGLATLALVVLGLLSLFYAGSRRALLVAGDEIMGQASRRVSERVEEHLGEAERALGSIEAQQRLGLLDASRPDTVEAAMLAALAGNPRVSEATFTYGRNVGVYEDGDEVHDPGELRLDPATRGQVSAWRSGGDSIVIRRLRARGEGWNAEERRLPSDAEACATDPPAVDPTLHATFTVPSRPDRRGEALWSDLAYLEADAALPEAARRHVVSVQKALWHGDDLVGVARVSLLSDRVDELTRVDIGDGASTNPHVVFLCDRSGRLVSRLGPRDRFALVDADGRPDDDGDLRVIPDAEPPQVAAALRAAATAAVGEGGSMVTRLLVGDTWYLVRYSALLGGRTQGWLVGIVVPESFYLGGLESARRRLFALAAALFVLTAAAGWLAVRAMRRDLGGLLSALARLGHFDFAATTPGRGAAFRDVAEASDRLEQAKTALRALGKYVPIDLVRQLYEARVEPVLGGSLREVTILFSDIEGFTTISEGLSPDELATALGAYLEAMTRAIHASGGIIDKYSGDGVMALWNAPAECADHARRACGAALACREATAALFASPAWKGRPPWNTRFGIHRDRVSVGHYGAPDRMSFTAMGDGVNLASRLEGLNKQYGTAILVSAAVEERARGAFVFRRVDRVAVKGRRGGVEIFELVGAGVNDVRPAVVERYERALEAYFARRFDEALPLLGDDADGDGPGRVLASRCRRYLAEPPPPDWDGIHVAREK